MTTVIIESIETGFRVRQQSGTWGNPGEKMKTHIDAPTEAEALRLFFEQFGFKFVVDRKLQEVA